MAGRYPTGSFYARKGAVWYPIAKAPRGAHIWFRICIDGHRHHINMETTDPAEAERRRHAWLAGIRLDSNEAFLKSVATLGQKAERELDRLLSGKGVAPRKRKLDGTLTEVRRK